MSVENATKLVLAAADTERAEVPDALEALRRRSFSS